jgi:hypothetical protein
MAAIVSGRQAESSPPQAASNNGLTRLPQRPVIAAIRGIGTQRDRVVCKADGGWASSAALVRVVSVLRASMAFGLRRA